MAVVGNEIEVPFLHQVVARSTHHLCVIAVPQIGNQNANGMGLLAAKRSSYQTRLVVEFDCCGFYTLARCRGD